jgi:hypothetical protein
MARRDLREGAVNIAIRKEVFEMAVQFRTVMRGSVGTAVLEDLASRERNRSVMTVTAIQRNIGKRGMDFTRHQIIRVLQNLEKSGAGKFIVGRRGRPSRFVGEVPATEFAKEARKQIVMKTPKKSRRRVAAA